MMRIVIDGRESGTTTGRYVDKLIENLHKIRLNFEVTILTKAHRVDYFKETASRFQIVESTYKEFTFGEQIGLLSQINKLKPDLVHFSMVQQPILYKGKVVTTMHDLTTTRFKNPSKNPLVYFIKQKVYIWVSKVVARRSKVVIAPSEFVKDDIAKFARINSRKIIVTYESADKINDKPEPVTKLEGAQFIMYVGRPMPHKNLYRLVTAFVELKKSQPKLKLVLVGKKDALFDQLESWVIEQGIKNVVFTDFVSEGELRWLYENCQAYVFPSLSEGFGLPPLEAMCHGAPVVSSNATCLPEISGQAAHYFDPNSIEDIASKINDVLTNRNLREELIRKGYLQVKKYSWQRMAEQTLDVYKSVLNDSISE
jgi:glycosyltransferase involved in cell wall biosynthesis